MRQDSLDAELVRCGVTLAPYARRRFSLNPRWFLVLAMVAIGTAAIAARAERRGRDSTLTVALFVYLAFTVVVLAMHLRQFAALRKRSSPQLRLIGWVLPTFGASRTVAELGGRRDSRARTAIVGLFAAPEGLTLHLDHTSAGRIVVTPEVPVFVGYRGSKRWLIVGPPADRYALPIHRLGVRVVPDPQRATTAAPVQAQPDGSDLDR